MDKASVRSNMQEVLDLIVSEITAIRTGRASPALVEDLEIKVYGGQQTLKIQELANITSSDSKSIVIDPWDKSIIGEIKKGIITSNIGLNPQIDGEIVRINLPPMTTEDREKHVKLLNTKIEHAKVMVRQVRGEAMKDIKSVFEDKNLSEDEKFNEEKKLQEITDQFVEKLAEVGDKKRKDILNI